MPISPTYPGVYIEEVPSGVRPIVGVATSIAAFIGNFTRGPMNAAVRILNREAFERDFGGLSADSLGSYAVVQFFLNGGNQAYIVRTAAGSPQSAAIILRNSADTQDVLTISAANEGVWGDNLRVDVDWGTPTPGTTFNLTAIEIFDDVVVNTESFRNLTMNTAGPRYAVSVINDESKLIRVEPGGSLESPAQTGTVSQQITDVSALTLTGSLTVDLNGSGGTLSLGSTPTTMASLAAELQAAIRDTDTSLEAVTVTVVGSVGTGAYLQVKAGTDNPADIVVLSGDFANDVGFAGLSQQNVQSYQLGGATVAGGKQLGALLPGNLPQTGDDGTLPTAAELTAALSALDRVDIFNILCIPGTDQLPDDQAFLVASEANTYVKSRRAMYILDPPNADRVRNEPVEIETWLDENATLRDDNTAVYYPRLRIPNPLNEFRLQEFPVSGTIAGLWARIDGERGVWKAPAGIEASLRGVSELEYKLTDDENGVLNPIAINALRTFRVAGNVAWGARTLVGADQLASEWKYVPVRRLALFIEESLYRGTQFAVFEPNDEPLWGQIRLNVGAFMQNLFLQGAFQGSTPRQAYLVKCDAETTTQDDVNRGIVNIVVGFAPLKPAEFVIIKIQQLAGRGQNA
jgi:phage tail sheath protein FI